MSTQATALRAMNDSRDGMLFIPSGTRIDHVPEPGVAGSKVGETLTGKTSKWDAKAKEALFLKGKMDIGDINQEMVGDCWYLAAMVSILNLQHGPMLLKKTMVDVGGGFAVVRLFDGALQPHYLRVTKSVLWFRGFGKVHASGLDRTGLWPAVLEKAACCMTEGSEHRDCDPLHPNYKNIEGGGSHDAFRMLLGVASQKLTLQNMNQRGDRVGRKDAEEHLLTLFAGGNWAAGSAIKPDKPDLVQASNPAVKDIVRKNLDALSAVFGWNGMSYLRWQEILQGLKRQRSPLLVSAGAQGSGTKVGSQGYELDFAPTVQRDLPADVAA